MFFFGNQGEVIYAFIIRAMMADISRNKIEVRSYGRKVAGGYFFPQ